MSASRPQPESDDELLSAFVDNELTAAQRAAVEARLQTDERARQIVADLRAASDAVQALPRAASPRDFAASVLGQIERERLAIEPSPLVTLPPLDDVAEQKRRRGLIYAAFAVAAALMLMFLRPADKPRVPDQVAQGNRGERVEADRGNVQLKTEAPQLSEDKDAAAPPPPMAMPPAPRQEADSSLARDRTANRELQEEKRTQSDLAATRAAVPAVAPAGPMEQASDAPDAAPLAAGMPAAGEAAGFGGMAHDSRLGGELRSLDATAAARSGEVDVFAVAATGDAAASDFERLLAANGITIVEEPEPTDAAKALSDALDEPGDRADATRKSSSPAGAYLIEASPEQVAALTAALRVSDGKLKLAAAKEMSDERGGSRRFREMGGGRGGFGGGGGLGGGVGGSEVPASGRAWRLSSAAARGFDARDAEVPSEALAADQPAEPSREIKSEVSQAAPRRVLFVLQPQVAAEAAMPAAPAAAEPQP